MSKIRTAIFKMEYHRSAVGFRLLLTKTLKPRRQVQCADKIPAKN